MVAFDKPTFAYNYQVESQTNALREYEQTKAGRAIPDKAPGRLMMASLEHRQPGSDRIAPPEDAAAHLDRES